MFIEKIHSFIAFIENQEQSRLHTHEQIDAALHRSSIDLFNEYLPLFEANNNITSALKPFKKSEEIAVADGLPVTVAKITGLETVVDGKYYSADELSDSEWFDRKTNPITGPELEYPIFRIEGSESEGVQKCKLEVLPECTTVKIYYLKTPVHPKYVFTPSGRGEIFDEENSVDIEWPEIAHNNIIAKTLSYLGIPMRDELLIQMEQIKK